MSDIGMRRVVGLTAIAGGVVALVGNLVHPRYSGDDVDVYRSIASSSLVRTADVFIIFAFILVAAALVGFARIWGSRGRTTLLGYYGSMAAVAGAALGLAGIAIDLFAYKEQAEQFVRADGRNIVSAFWATNAIDHINSAMLDITTLVLLGLAPLLIASAQLLERANAPRLSLTGVAGGAVCVVVGVVGLLIRDQSNINIPFLVGSLLVTVWVLATGVHLLQTPDVIDITDDERAEKLMKAEERQRG